MADDTCELLLRRLMTIDDILSPSDVLIGLYAASKTALLEHLARHASQSFDIDQAEFLSALLRREDLGSTGIGDGVALPHARLDAVRAPFGILARLRDPINFDAVDDRPIDLAFLLLLPAAGARGAHLNALACIARRLRDPDAAAAMRRARDAADLFAQASGRTLSEA